jgi:hypothetical protein
MQGLVRKIPRLVPSLVTLVTLLAGCSGAGNVNLGSGQTADPATVDFPIAYVKRTIPTRADDLRQRRDALPDADLWVRDRASPGAPERNVTERVTKTDRYDVKDVDVSADGKRFIFAMRGPLAMNQDEEDPPTWGIWEYVPATDLLKRVIVSATIAAEGNDVSPHYLPDGRIVFSSTRQRQSKAILLDEGKPGFEAQTEDRNEPAFVLHVMNGDGTNIHQISFNQSHDVDTTVLSGGRLMYSRWDHSPGKNGIHLYSANPDGTDLQLLYGAQSHTTSTPGQTVQFVHAREMQNGKVLALIRPASGTGIDFGGDLVIIDTKTYVENTQPTLANAGMSGPAQTRATPNEVLTIPGPSPGGRFSSAFPLWDGSNRILVTWTQCRLSEGGAIVPCTSERLAAASPVPAAVLYSVWMFDPADNTLKPVMAPVEGVMLADVAAAQPRSLPAVILDKVAGLDLDTTLVGEGVGVIDIRSVYDFDGVQATAPAAPDIATLANPGLRTAAQRPARFLRLEKPVSMPDDDVLDFDNAAFGASNFMREILGYVPVEPDGSVVVRVPANVAFQMSITDGNGRRISPLHRNWLQVRPGEMLKCNGCHNPNTNPVRSHGRSGLFAQAWAGAPTTGAPFTNTEARFSPNAGETMAQTRARWSRSNDNSRSTIPSMDVKFTDEWTDPAGAGRAKDPSSSFLYADLTTPLPTSAACTVTWASTCRGVINYVRHIHPLWSKPRVTLAADMVTVLTDHTCTSCHSKLDAANAARVPAGNFDLADGDSNVEPLQKEAYRQLLFARNEVELVGGAVVPRIVITIGPDGQPQQNNVSLAPPMSAGNARGSGRFFDRFAVGGTHANYLTPAELRLLSEWVDIGAQYFNNPFDPAVPLN